MSIWGNAFHSLDILQKFNTLLVNVNPYNMASPIGTDHLTRPFFPVPMSKKKSGLGSETIVKACQVIVSAYTFRR